MKHRAARTSRSGRVSQKMLKTKALKGSPKAKTMPPDPDAAAKLAQLKFYEEALKYFQQQKFQRARQSLERALEGPSRELRDRAQVHVRICEQHVHVLLYGTKGEQFEVLLPPGAKQGQQHAGKKIKFNGVVTQLEHHYRQYRKQGTSNAGMDEYLKKVMVEYDCPECGGRLVVQVPLAILGGDEAGERLFLFLCHSFPLSWCSGLPLLCHLGSRFLRH